VRISKLSSDGIVTLLFTNSMNTLSINEIQTAKFYNSTTEQE